MPLYAGLAAANGLNPIPGLDVAADIALLLKMGDAIANIYGLSSRQFEYIKRLLGPNALPGLVAKIAQFAAKYVAKEGVILLLRQIATRMTAKEASKWIPFVGPLIAAGIAWKATFILGEQMIDEAENLAREILEAIIRGSDLPSGSSEYPLARLPPAASQRLHPFPRRSGPSGPRLRSRVKGRRLCPAPAGDSPRSLHPSATLRRCRLPKNQPRRPRTKPARRRAGHALCSPPPA